LLIPKGLAVWQAVCTSGGVPNLPHPNPSSTAIGILPEALGGKSCQAGRMRNFKQANEGYGLPLWLTDNELLALIKVRIQSDPDGPFASGLVQMLTPEPEDIA
jgi:hypothetical protein